MISSKHSLGCLFKHSLFTATITISILILASGFSNTAKAATIVGPSGADLQAAMNADDQGDTIISIPSILLLTCMLPEDLEGLVWLIEHLFVGLLLYLIFRGAQLAKRYVERRLDQIDAKLKHRRKKRRKTRNERGK